MGPVHVAKSSDSLPALSIRNRNGRFRNQVLGPLWWMWPASHAT
jgi:ABC-type polysaccharide/polyol phosphate export permease